MKVIKYGNKRVNYNAPIRFACPTCQSILQAKVKEFGEKKFSPGYNYYVITCPVCEKEQLIDSNIVDPPFSDVHY